MSSFNMKYSLFAFLKVKTVPNNCVLFEVKACECLWENINLFYCFCTEKSIYWLVIPIKKNLFNLVLMMFNTRWYVLIKLTFKNHIEK